MIRLSLPERIPLSYTLIFASMLFLLQQMEHTSLYFSACSFLFIMIVTQAFNVAGGLTRPSGGYIFFYATLAVIVGLCVKAILGERGDSNLMRPHLTITVYAVSSVMLLLVALATRRFAKRRPILKNLVGDNNLPNATIGCLVVGIFLTFATRATNRGSGTAWSALIQINRFCELAILLGVTNVIRRSGGRRSINIPVILSSITLFVVGGLFGFSKEALFTPVICWALAAAAQRFRITLQQLVFSGAAMAFMVYYMVPYSQYGRTQMRNGLGPSLQVAVNLLSDLTSVRAHYLAQTASDAADRSGGYFNRPQGLWDRLEMISYDDQLNDATERLGPEGYFPLLTDFENLIPHAFWPGKPSYLWGNIYAHEAGVNIAEDDMSTGISFSPTGEAYHLGKWVGIMVAAPLVWLATFVLFDSLCGDVRESPWGLLTLTYFAHIAPEGLLAGPIYAMGYISFAIAFAAATTGYVMPLVGSLFVGPASQSLGPAQPLRVRPPRAVPLGPSGGDQT